MNLNSNNANTPPAIWAIIYKNNLSIDNWLFKKNIMETAGLKCPPVILPNMAIAIIRPNPILNKLVISLELNPTEKMIVDKNTKVPISSPRNSFNIFIIYLLYIFLLTIIKNYKKNKK